MSYPKMKTAADYFSANRDHLSADEAISVLMRELQEVRALNRALACEIAARVNSDSAQRLPCVVRLGDGTAILIAGHGDDPAAVELFRYRSNS